MAEPDHTALIRPLFPVDDTVASPCDCLRVASATTCKRRPPTPPENLARLANILSRLLFERGISPRRQHRGCLLTPERAPFSSA